MDILNLLKLISNDDQKAFERFYFHYYEKIFRFSYYIIQDKDACREVVSNVFFSAWQSRKKLPDVRNIETYLYVVTRNEANRYLKRKCSHNDFSLEEIPLQFESSVDPSPEEALQAKEITELVNRVVNELPERCRLIFLMKRQEGLSSKEIAEILSINESTVRVQIKIALDKIISSLRLYYPELILLYLLVLNIFK